jgi:predicted DsbA family dithiol-disulfide isomerase
MKVLAATVDFVCPFCHLAQGPLGAAAGKYGCELDWRPYETHPESAPDRPPRDDEPDEERLWRQSVRPLAASTGATIHRPTGAPRPRTRLAWEGFQHAKAHGLGAEYVRAVFAAYFELDQDIGRPDVLARVAAAVGLDPAAFRRDLDTGSYAPAHRQALGDAAADGVQSVPVVALGRRRFVGLPREEELAHLIEGDELPAMTHPTA